MNLSNRSEQLIGKLYYGRKHMELTIGTLKDGHIKELAFSILNEL